MGCVSSTFLSHDDEFPQIGGSTTFAHHIVSLTSTTYGLLTLDPPSTPPPPSSSAAAVHPSPTTAPRSTLASLLQSSELPEVINSWELMAGLDSTPPPIPPKPSKELEKSNLVTPLLKCSDDDVVSRKFGFGRVKYKYPLDGFEEICPPNGEDRVVIYTTSLRGVRKTFEDCNGVSYAIEGWGLGSQEGYFHG